MLRDELIGGWDLVSFTGKTPSGRTFYPMGQAVAGRLLYTSNGQVGVSLMEGDRPRPDPDVRIGLLEDGAAAPLARSYMAYAGAFTVDEDSHVVTHNFELCLDPALIGTLQQRHARFVDDGRLELTVPQFQLDRFEAPMSLVWRRC